MKQQISPSIVIAIIAVLVIIIGAAAWRSFAHSPADGETVKPEQAGMGRPMTPAGPTQKSGQ